MWSYEKKNSLFFILLICFKLLDLNKKIYIPSKHYVALKLGEMK